MFFFHGQGHAVGKTECGEGLRPMDLRCFAPVETGYSGSPGLAYNRGQTPRGGLAHFASALLANTSVGSP